MFNEHNKIKYEVPCETPEEFWEELSPLKLLDSQSSNIIYRGQRKAQWGLIPGVLRPDIPFLKILLKRKSPNQIFFEKAILNQFTKRCDLLGLKIPNDSSELREILDPQSRQTDKYYINPSAWPDERLFEIMALAQHHGLPTQLLDWSRRSYVAAYFAASSALANHQEQDTKIAVWALDQDKISKCMNIKLVKVPGSTSNNLAAQSGLFTVLQQQVDKSQPYSFGSLEDEFEQWENAPIRNITLPVKYAARILLYCDVHGISAATLFPNYSGAAKAVVDWLNQMST